MRHLTSNLPHRMPVHARVHQYHATPPVYLADAAYTVYTGIVTRVTPTCYFSLSSSSPSRDVLPLPSELPFDPSFSSTTQPAAARRRLCNLPAATTAAIPHGYRRPSSCHLTAHINARHASHHLPRSRTASAEATTSVALLVLP